MLTSITGHARRAQGVYEGMAERMKYLGAVGDPMFAATPLRWSICSSCSRCAVRRYCGSSRRSVSVSDAEAWVLRGALVCA
jgi:hypothetical protein